MFTILIPIILAVMVGISGFFGYEKQRDNLTFLEQQVAILEQQLEASQDVSLGSYYSVTGKYYRLWGSGITSSATSLILQSFKLPVNDQEITMANFGSEVGYGVIEPENSSNMEVVSFTGISQNSGSDQATLTGVIRGINFVYPYNSSSTLAKSHAGGSRFIISDPSAHWSEYAGKRNDEFIEGDWTYYATNTPQYFSHPTFSNDLEIIDKKYADDAANAGAANAATTTAGIVQIATAEQLKQATTTGTSGRLLVPYLYQYATSTDKRGATTTIVMTDTDGKIDQTFLPLSEAITWTGSNTFNASTSFYGATGTFSNIPTLPNRNPTGDDQATRKAYVDSFAYGIFGDGTYGASTTDATTTLSRDVYYTTLTVNSGITLYTGGYRIFVNDTLTNNGTISNAGTNATTSSCVKATGGKTGSLGGGAVGSVTDVCPAAAGNGGGGGGVMVIAAKTLTNTNGTITAAGGNGGNATTVGATNSTGLDGQSTTTSLGGNGGVGGAGDSHAGAGYGTSTAPLAIYGGFHHLPQAIALQVMGAATTTGDVWNINLVKGGSGGGAGGGGYTNPQNSGGGGGGGGGVLTLVYNTLSSGTETVAGGTGGAKTGSGIAGSNGSAGTKITIDVNP